MGNRTKHIHIRLTEEEYLFFKEKAEAYKGLTALIIDAVNAFDERKGKNYIDSLIEFSEKYSSFLGDIGRIGNNLNQIARTLNESNLRRIAIENFPVLGLMGKANEGIELLKNIKRTVNKIASRPLR